MPIGEQTTIASHTGNGVATVFAYSFGVLAADDIKVLVDGVVVTTGFTVSGIGSRTGGTVTFSVAPTSGADILIVREVVRKRDTDYQYSGDLREEVLDDDLDRIWMTLQEDGELVDRGVRVPVGETLSELPAAASRVDKVLTFGSGGAIALVDVAAFSGGGVVELVPADGSIALVKLTTAVQNLINGALQRSGGTMTGKVVLDGDATLALHPVPLQQLEDSVDTINTALGLRMQYSLTATQTASGLSVDFTGIPSWAKRVTVMFTELSTNGTSGPVFQLGAGSYKTTGYAGSQALLTAGVAVASLTSGFSLGGASAASIRNGTFTFSLQGANIWACSGVVGFSDSAGLAVCGGYVSLAGALDRLRLFFGGTDTADSGTVSILIEG